jgi:SAM-dependent methyltransferase
MNLAVGQPYEEWKSWKPEDFGRFDAVEARYFEAELESAGVRVGKGTRILEIGFGNGRFAGWVASKGAEYCGTELNEGLVSLAKRKGLDAFPATSRLEELAGGRPFDCVLAFDVLEHLTVEEIVTLFRSVCASLAEQGRFVARVPSGDSPFSGPIQYGDATHKTIIGSGMVHQLVQGSGLEVVDVRCTAFPITGLGMRRFLRRLPVVVVRALVSRLLNAAFNDNQPRIMTPNMVMVLRKAASEKATSVASS